VYFALVRITQNVTESSDHVINRTHDQTSVARQRMQRRWWSSRSLPFDFRIHLSRL